MAEEKVYTEEEVQDWLKAHLPAWEVRDGMLVRTYRTGNWPRSCLVAQAIAFLGEAAWHHPDLLVRYGEVEVRLVTHSAGGITDKDLALARRIESLITWVPGEEDPFTGPPKPILRLNH